MSRIVGIGANVCDTLFTVPKYPIEDTKLGALDMTQAGGGPCATGLVAAAKLGGECSFIGNLTDDNSGLFLMADMKKYNIGTELTRVIPGHTSFTSCIWNSKESTSRTIVFYRGDIPATVLDDQQIEAIKNANVLLIDGNDMSAAQQAVKIAKENGTKVVYDAGGLYEGIESLLPYVDILIPSEEYALGLTKAETAEEAAKILYEKYSPEVVVITQGKKGGVFYDGKEIKTYPVFEVNVVDSNGSGDVFHGAYAFCVDKGYDYYDACIFCSAVSALKCTKIGSRKAVPTFDEVSKFLKERGVNA